MQHRERKQNPVVQWIVFVVVAAVLGAAVWGVWAWRSGRLVDAHLPGVPSDNTTLTVGVTGAPRSLDIRTATGDDARTLEQLLMGNVYETLVGHDHDNKLTPGLATSWQASDDGLTYTFHLRGDARFAGADGRGEGARMTASDAVWSIQQAVKHQWPDHDRLGDLASVDAPDATTLTITLRSPNPALPRVLAGRLGIVYPSDKTSLDYATEAVGTGPYAVRSFDPGRQVVLARNPAHSGTPGATATITVRLFDDDAALAKAMAGGDGAAPDLAVPSAGADPAPFRAVEGATVTQGMGAGSVFLYYNYDADAITSIIRVRQGLQQAVDKAALVQSVPGASKPLGGVFGPLDDGYEDLTGLMPYDPDTVHRLITYFYNPNYVGTLRLIAPTALKATADAVGAQLRETVARPVQVDVLDDAAFRQRLDERSFEMALSQSDGADDAYAFSTSDNPGHATSSAAQEQYHQAMAATSDQAWQDGLKAYARTLTQEGAANWLYVPATTVATAKGVSGVGSANMADRWLPLAGIAKR
ncbi:hypothetical protein H7U32_07140 [Bifidobacterium pullorum subsp. saeculare]|uniref:Solute-binding protein family 5 domain-containing protein n=1 Tax=Bifidobacterium pullorum subsp. saeculare TaxID=78257 RepID=A0A938WWA6_9BIFI|nr:ABC transporter substrate-binding protein [Bifidobacterium pullorum]MBM6700075.1 hypothetical protein [Bifidobacterium pullorum subsp. saeculare]